MVHTRLRDLIDHDRVMIAASSSHNDQIAIEVFGNARPKPFVSTPPAKTRVLKEPRLANFDAMGSNEQILVNKLLRGDATTIHLTGGIGVGKSRFLRHFEEDILPALQHGAETDRGRCPLVFYVDCNNFAAMAGSCTEAPDEILRQVTPLIFDTICVKLSTCYTIREEIGTIWDELIARNASNRPTNPAIVRLQSMLRDHELLEESNGLTAAELIERRKPIRRELVSDPEMRGFYVAALLNYVSEKYFKDHPECMMVVVDNIDLHGIVVQACVKRVLQPLFNLSRVRIVLALRYTTERQVFSVQTNASYTVDSIPYQGADPMQIIRSRIEHACANKDEVLGFVAPGPGDKIVAFLNRLDQMHFGRQRDVITQLLQSLAGESVRKGLVYAQALINNSVYDPAVNSLSSISDSDIMRAIMVGTATTFQESASQSTCNLFQVLGSSGAACFLKLRALRAVAVRGELRVADLVGYLQSFGYQDSRILDGINELISPNKRLLWSDAVQRFGSASDLITHGDSRLNLSKAGDAYQSYLYRRIEYLQEVMLDTFVPEDLAGPGWNLNQIEDRFSLVAVFLEHLIDLEIAEVSRLARPNALHQELSQQEEFFTKRMCTEVLDSASRILAQSARSGNLATFLEDYQERVRMLIDRVHDAQNGD